MKKFIVGILLGGLLLSGGWFTYAAVQSEVGIQIWDSVNSRWIKTPTPPPTTSAAPIARSGGLLPVAPLYPGGSDTFYPPLACAAANNPCTNLSNTTTAIPSVGSHLMAHDTGVNWVMLGATTAATTSVPETEYGLHTKGLNLLYCGSGDGNTSNSCATPGWFPARGRSQSTDDVAPSGGDLPGRISPVNVTLHHEFDGTNYDRVRHSFVQSTTGVTTNAAGTTITMTTTPMSKYTMVIDRTVGATDVVEIDLQCSINNTAFVQIATITSLASEPALTSIGDIPCQYMRYNVVTVGAGNTLAIDLLATR